MKVGARYTPINAQFGERKTMLCPILNKPVKKYSLPPLLRDFPHKFLKIANIFVG